MINDVYNILTPQKSFSDSLADPEFIISDFAKFERPAQLHLAYQALDAFVKEEGQLPRPYNKDDGHKLVECAKKINSEATNKVGTEQKKKFFWGGGQNVPAQCYNFISQDDILQLITKLLPMRQIVLVVMCLRDKPVLTTRSASM